MGEAAAFHCAINDGESIDGDRGKKRRKKRQKGSRSCITFPRKRAADNVSATGKQRGQVTRKLGHSGRLRLRLSGGIMLVAVHATFAVAGPSISAKPGGGRGHAVSPCACRVVAASVGGAPRNLPAT